MKIRFILKYTRCILWTVFHSTYKWACGSVWKMYGITFNTRHKWTTTTQQGDTHMKKNTHTHFICSEMKREKNIWERVRGRESAESLYGEWVCRTIHSTYDLIRTYRFVLVFPSSRLTPTLIVRTKFSGMQEMNEKLREKKTASDFDWENPNIIIGIETLLCSYAWRYNGKKECYNENAIAARGVCIKCVWVSKYLRRANQSHQCKINQIMMLRLFKRNHS